jgi:hypothetical protein
MMILNLRRTAATVCLGVVALASSLSAQIEVNARLSKRDFVANEPVLVTITITNRAGRDIFLHGDSRNSWLDFILKNERGVPLSTFSGNPGFKAVNVPAGRSVSRTVDLSKSYRVTTLGRYGGYATVRMPGEQEAIYTSNRISFNVSTGRALFSRKIGVPSSKTTREYKVMNFSNGKKTELFVEVEDGRTGRIMRTFSLGETLTFHKPEATIDGANNLNVLFLNSPSVFVHARINPEGKLLGREFFKRAATGEPRLMTFDNGEVRTAGGVPYDPAAEQAQRAKVRRLSERPPFAYR